jgi:hypothetical protein
MTESSSDQLLITLTAAFKADAQIHNDVADRVFDHVPGRTEYPYLLTHITSSDEWDTSTEDGEEHTLFILVYDDKEGPKRVRRIMRRVKELQHDNASSYTLTDHNLVNCRRMSETVSREGQLYHGAATYRAITEET